MDYNHSRPWEKLPQAVLNLLDLHSMHASWDSEARVWRVYPKNDSSIGGWPVWPTDTLEQWVLVVGAASEVFRRMANA